MRPIERRLAVLSAASLALLATNTAIQAKPLPHDSRNLTGKLKNGLTWMYRQHDNPPGKMALMMHVRTGSFNETDEQRGLAHFMEHLVFNGTEHYPPGKLIEYFESIGMEFGADLNASTGFDRTVYMLFLPDAKTDTVDRGLMTLSDYAFRASLLEEEIDKERGIILEELRTGQDFQERIRDKLWPELFAGSRLASRLPIGVKEVISEAPRSAFEDYYRTWYRPEQMTVILVGDAKPDGLTPLVEKWFGEYRPSVPHRSPHGAEFKPFTQERAIVVTDPELVRCSVALYNLGPGRPPTVGTEQWRTELVEHVGTWIVGRRCQERVQKGEASYLYAGANVFDAFNEALFIHSMAGGEPAKWANMLEELIMEVNRAQQHGFTARELELARKEIIAGAERAVKTESSRNARRLLFGIMSSVNDQEPYLSAQQELDLYTEMLGTIKLDEVNRAFRDDFKPGTYAYVLQLPEKEDVAVPPRDDVLAAARAAWARKVEPPKTDEVPTDLLAAAPKPGTVAESATDADLGITSAWLSNGARVHHRFMDYKKDTVMVSISLAGGRIEEGPENVGITEVASLAVNQPATSRLTSTNIRDLMTGKNITVRAGGAADDALTLSVNGSPKDLETGLQLAHALLTDGRIEETAWDTWKRSRVQRIEQNQTDPRYKAYEAMADLVSGGDPRRVFLTPDQIRAVKLPEAQKWFERLRRSAPIEVAVVGDIALDDAMPLVLKYIGSLPERTRTAEHLDPRRRLARTTGPLRRDVRVETISPQAVGMAGFVGCEGRHADDERALELASNILTSRLIKHIREELAMVYSIGTRNVGSWTYVDSGLFMAQSMCDPAGADRLGDLVHGMFKDFADSGPKDDELEDAKKQIANNLDTRMREPSYWLRVLRHLDLHHRSLDEQKRHKAAYDALSAEQVQKVFNKYYTPERRFTVTATPTKIESAKEEKPAAPSP